MTTLSKGKVIATLTQLLFAGEVDAEQGLMLRGKLNNEPNSVLSEEMVRADAKAFLAPPHAQKLLAALGL